MSMVWISNAQKYLINNVDIFFIVVIRSLLIQNYTLKNIY